MTTSGSYNYNPSIGEVVLYAFNLCQVRSTSVVQEHLNSARQAMNMMLSRWSNMGVNLWKVDTDKRPSSYEYDALPLEQHGR